MNFKPVTDWRNWRTATREARLSAGTVVTLSESATDAQVFLTHPHASITSFGPAELCMTPAEAFALGAELMQAAMRQGVAERRAAA